METHLALTIIGTVLSLVGILFFLIPEKVNEKVMTDLSDSAVQPAAALRSVLGGSAMWSGLDSDSFKRFSSRSGEQLIDRLWNWDEYHAGLDTAYQAAEIL